MDRNSFILHKDSLCVLDDMTQLDRGELFYAIYKWQLGEEIELTPLVKIAFSQFKNQFSRDNLKYNQTVEKRKLAGAKGGKQKVANASKCKQKVANVADSDSKSVNDSDSVSKNKNNNVPDNNNLLSDFSESEKVVIQKWFKYKAEKKQSYKSIALESFITQLKNNKAKGCNLVEAINITMANNWQGVVFDKGYADGKQNKVDLNNMSADKYIDHGLFGSKR